MKFEGIPFAAGLAVIAGSAGILAILHLLRVRSRQLRVVTTLFWESAIEQPRARTLFDKFRHAKTYLLLLLICILLALTLMQPRFAGDSTGSICQVIVLDAGGSMSDVNSEDGANSFEEAKKAVMQRVRQLSVDDQLALVAVNPWPRLIHDLDDPHVLAGKSIEGVRGSELPAARDEAIKLARLLIEGKANPRILFVTDRAYEPDPELVEGVNLEVQNIGQSKDNAAILFAGFEGKSGLNRKGNLRVRVGYWGKNNQETTLVVQRQGGALLFNQSAIMESGSTHDFIVADLPADGDTLVLDLTPADGLASDNQLTFRLPFRPVIHVGDDASFPEPLRYAFEADTAVEAEKNCPKCFKRKDCPRRLKGKNLVFVQVVDQGPMVEGGNDLVPAETLAGNLQPGMVKCGTGVGVDTTGEDLVPLLLSGDAVVAASSKGDDPRILYLGSSLFAEDSNFCRTPGFAIFIGEALRQLGGWDDSIAVFPPERGLADPLWRERSSGRFEPVSMPGSRLAGDLSSVGGQTTEGSANSAFGWSLPFFWEVMLGFAIALFGLEAFLHVRGRIP